MTNNTDEQERKFLSQLAKHGLDLKPYRQKLKEYDTINELVRNEEENPIEVKNAFTLANEVTA